jgi:hypothetical protein
MDPANISKAVVILVSCQYFERLGQLPTPRSLQEDLSRLCIKGIMLLRLEVSCHNNMAKEARRDGRERSRKEQKKKRERGEKGGNGPRLLGYGCRLLAKSTCYQMICRVGRRQVCTVGTVGVYTSTP